MTGLVWRCFDWGASFIWAMSGARTAARRNYDFTGIFAIALVTCAGGGLIRDLLLLRGPPLLVRSPVYIAVAGAAALIVWVLGERLRYRPIYGRAELIATAVGLGAFAVVGMDLAIAAQVSLPGVVLVGVANAVGGAVLQSVLLQEAPPVFKPGELTALAALIGCLTHVILLRAMDASASLAAAVTVTVVAAVRMASLRFRIETQPAFRFPAAHRRRRVQLRVAPSPSGRRRKE
jgi:uncharacterized membrane protein YeiH